jgi:RHS repeat-associated protein
LYENIDSTRSGLPPGYPSDTYTDPNSFVARLNASDGKKIGPAILLKVMAGDSVNIRCSSWYRLNGAAPGDPANPLADLLVNLVQGVLGVAGGKFNGQQLSEIMLPPGITEMLAERSSGFNVSRPRAYLSWILLDEQFHYVSGSSGFEQVGEDTVLTTWIKTGLPMSKNGYLYVYTGNESPVNVYFDNLQVSHVRGALLEETHYYPFGLTMAGISSKAAGKLENKKNKFQGQEFNDDLGVDMYEFKYRMHDPQTGRFWQVDPLANKYVYNSTYAFSENKVTSHIELEGLEALTLQDVWRSAGITKNSAEQINNKVVGGLERGAKMSKDVLTVAGGVTVIIASGGTAAPALALASGGLAIGGGSAKLVLDAQGQYNKAEGVPTTLAGTAVFTINQMVGNDKNGNKLISQEFQSTVEFAEGALTFNFKDFSKVSGALKQGNATLAAISLTLDGAELPDKVKTMLVNMLNSGNNSSMSNANKPASDHPEDRKAARDAEMREKMRSNQ